MYNPYGAKIDDAKAHVSNTSQVFAQHAGNPNFVGILQNLNKIPPEQDNPPGLPKNTPAKAVLQNKPFIPRKLPQNQRIDFTDSQKKNSDQMEVKGNLDISLIALFSSMTTLIAQWVSFENRSKLKLQAEKVTIKYPELSYSLKLLFKNDEDSKNTVEIQTKIGCDHYGADQYITICTKSHCKECLKTIILSSIENNQPTNCPCGILMSQKNKNEIIPELSPGFRSKSAARKVTRKDSEDLDRSPVRQQLNIITPPSQPTNSSNLQRPFQFKKVVSPQVFQNIQKANTSRLLCVICNNIKDNDDFTVIQCSGHDICSKCRVLMFLKLESCPVCKRNYSEMELGIMEILKESFSNEVQQHNLINQKKDQNSMCVHCGGALTIEEACFYECEHKLHYSCSKGQVCPICKTQ